MKHDLNSSVGGRPLLFARDFLKQDISFTVSSAARLLKEEDEVVVLGYLGALIDAGYLMRDTEMPDQHGQEVFLPTRLGISLRKTKKRKRMARSVAERHLAALLSAVERVNTDIDLISWVEEVDLFGSFPEGADEVGDVDVAVRLTRRLPDKAWVRASSERAKAAGFKGGFVEMITWGEVEVWRMLRNVSRYLDLQPKDDIVSEGWPLTPVYRRNGDPPQ